MPLQLSATSQSPAALRHTPVRFASAGHVADVPVQFSARSQTPAATRHTVDEGSKPSDGQAALVPVQVSATSQMPAD